MLIDLKKYDQLPSVPKQHAYIDEAASLKCGAWMIESGDFDYHSFAELCNLLEAIVLYDQLYTCPIHKYADPPRVDVISPFIKQLATEGILDLLDAPFHLLYQDAPKTEDTEKYRKGMKIFEQGKKASVIHIEYLGGVGMASVYDMHIHPSISNSAGYLELLQIPKSVEATSALLKAYRGMSRAITSDIENIIKLRGNISVPIPPIPLEILKKVTKPEEILEEALHLRKRFQSVRDAYAEYVDKISDINLPLQKSLSAQVKLQQILKELTSPFGTGEKRQIFEWSSLPKMVESAPELASGDATSLVQIILGKPFEWIRYWLSRREFMQLYRLRKSAFKTAGYELQVKKIWGNAANFAGEPPERLHEKVDYPMGTDWRTYDFDQLCLWSWTGKYIGYREGNELFSATHKHVGHFVGNDVYSLDGRYLGEFMGGRLIAVKEHRNKRITTIQAIKHRRAMPGERMDLDMRELPASCEDFFKL